MTKTTAIPLSPRVPLLPILLVALGSGCAPVHGDNPEALRSEILEPPRPEFAATVERARPIVRAAVVGDNLPGLSLAVAVDGEIVWAEGFGWADIDARHPVTPRTRFRIGGVATTMTAAAAGLLVERGQLDLDLPVRRYMPGFPEKRWPVTTRHLMGHTAGIRHDRDDEDMLYRRTRCTAPLDALGLYADDPLRFEPGTAYAYSGFGWTLVGAVVEAAAGEPFLDFMQREVFDPLGMGDTVLDDPARPAAETTSFYWPVAARTPIYGIEDANNPDNTCLQGAAALLSTPSDVVRFGAAMHGGRLIREDTLAMLRTPVELASGESTGSGLGWFVRQQPVGPTAEPMTVFGHDGVSAGGTTSFLTVPEPDVVVAVTANVSYAGRLSSLSARLAELFVVARTDPGGR